MTDLTPKQREALDPSLNIAVTAGAGSGKTKVLVQRYISILESDGKAGPSSILALTFTEKAASEMRAKVRKEIRERADREGGRWEAMLDELEGADISTIHSFCMKLVRGEPVPCGLDPEMGVLTEMGSSKLFSETLSGMLLTDGPAAQPLRRLVADLGNAELERTMKRLLSDMGRMDSPMEGEDFRDRCLGLLRSSFDEASRSAAEGLKGVVPSLKVLSGVRSAHGRKDQLSSVVSALGPSIGIVKCMEGADPKERSDDLLRALFGAREWLLTVKGGPRSFGHKGNPSTWGKDLSAVRDALPVVASFVSEHLVIMRFYSRDGLKDMAEERLSDLLCVLSTLLRIFRSKKMEANSIDFNDQIDMALVLVEGNVNGMADRLRRRYSHILLDEFQDTDPRQWRLVSRLWEGYGSSKLFVVGDPKQSIYGFRSADVRIFRRASKAISDHPEGRSVVLDRNFRCRFEVMSFVNAVFDRVFASGNGPGEWGVAYDPLEAHRGKGGSVTVAGVFGPKGSEAREGAFAVDLIRRSVGRTMVEDEDGSLRPMRWSDVAILLPYRTGSKHYEEALRASSIPYTVHKGKGFFDRQEVRDVLDLLFFLTNTNDDAALASVLKGPFFSLGDEDLIRTTMNRGRTLFERLAVSHRRDSYDRLCGLIGMVRAMPPALALSRMLRDVGAYGLVGGRRECLNLDKLVEWAASQVGDGSMRDLARILASAVEDPPLEGEPSLRPDADSVSVMTVHSAKGLEWPMVLVLGLDHEGRKASGPYSLDPDRGIGLKVIDDAEGALVATPSFIRAREVNAEREEQEERRLLYVACTRARDHLVLSGLASDGREDPRGPRSMMGMLMAGMGISAEDLRSGLSKVGGVDVRLVALTSESIQISELVGTEGPDKILSGDGGGDVFRFLCDVPAQASEALLNPTASAVLSSMMGAGTPLTSFIGGTGDGGPRRLKDVSPRTMGEMVHMAMLGAPADRVVREYGCIGALDDVKARVKALEGHLVKMRPVRQWRELEVCTTADVGGLGTVKVMGRMDVVIRRGDGTYMVIDHKTGRDRPEHRAQLEVYGRMLEGLLRVPVRKAVLTMEGPKEL